MKSTTVSYTNQKGQIVIPKAYRDELSITERSPLLFTLIGTNIILTPVKGVITKQDSEDTYLDILKKTRGKWGGRRDRVSEKKRKLELKASKKRRKLW